MYYLLLKIVFWCSEREIDEKKYLGNTDSSYFYGRANLVMKNIGKVNKILILNFVVACISK